MSSNTRLARPAAWGSSALLVVGSALFIAGGAQHPRASTDFGPLGSDQFWHSFAAHITHHPNWIAIHVLILLGPILWALGVPARQGAANERSHDAAETLEHLARRSILLGAMLWTVAFVIDGFVAVQTATSIAAASTTELPGLLAVFRFHQHTMARLGLIAWVLIGLTMALYGASAIIRARAFGARPLIGAWGVVVGLWPIVAALTGEFDPGPFTSRLWNVTALASAFWFTTYGVSLLVREREAVASGPRGVSTDLALQE